MTARDRILSLAKDADRAIAKLVLAMDDAGIEETGTALIDIFRTQLDFHVPQILDNELPSAAGRRRRGAVKSNVVNIVPLLRNRRELAEGAARRERPSKEGLR